MTAPRPKDSNTIDYLSKRRFNVSLLSKMDQIDPLLQDLHDKKLLYMYSTFRSPSTLEEVTSKADPGFVLKPVDRPNPIKKHSHKKTLSLDSSVSCFIDSLNSQYDSDSEEDLFGKLESIIDFPSLAEERFESNRSSRSKHLETLTKNPPFIYPSTLDNNTFSDRSETSIAEFPAVSLISQTDKKLNSDIQSSKLRNLIFQNPEYKLDDLPNASSNNLLKSDNHNKPSTTRNEPPLATLSTKDNDITLDESPGLSLSLISSKDSVGSDKKSIPGISFTSKKVFKVFKNPTSRFKDQNLKSWVKNRFNLSSKNSDSTNCKQINQPETNSNDNTSQPPLAMNINNFEQCDLIPHLSQTSKKINVKGESLKNKESNSKFKLLNYSHNRPFSRLGGMPSVSQLNNYISIFDNNNKKPLNKMYMSDPFASFDEPRDLKLPTSPKQDLHVTFRNSLNLSISSNNKQPTSNLVHLSTNSSNHQPFVIKLSKPSDFFPGMYSSALETTSPSDNKYHTTLSPETPVSKPVNLIRSFSNLRNRDKGIYYKRPMALSNLNQISI